MSLGPEVADSDHIYNLSCFPSRNLVQFPGFESSHLPELTTVVSSDKTMRETSRSGDYGITSMDTARGEQINTQSQLKGRPRLGPLPRKLLFDFLGICDAAQPR